MEENIDDNSEQYSSTTSKRHKRSTSKVWEDFEKLPIGVDGKERARCKFFDKEYVSNSKIGTSNLLCCICPSKEPKEPHHSLVLDQEKYREKMATTIIRHDYPFKFVEHEGIRDLHLFLHPDAKYISRNTAKSDVLKLFEREKDKLKNLLESCPSRICLTSDLWTSLTTDGYLSLTGHYVDKDWVLQKKVLNFRHVPPPHNGPIIAERVIHLLKEWGIDKKIFSITLDNASYNNGLVEVLKSYISLTDRLFCGGEFFHIRCGAYVLNIIVQAGLKVIDKAIYNIRESVKYVRGSEARKIKFAECMIQYSLHRSKKLKQDVTTRWNSTYLMLECALMHRRAFDQLKLIDTSFKTCPSEEEWQRVEKIVKFLKPFYDITTLFSELQYPTANLYFYGIWKIEWLIKEESASEDEVVQSMASRMKVKFEKYWECYSMVLSFAVILDPRYKLQFVEFCLKKLNSKTYLDGVKNIREKLYCLFEEYLCPIPSSVSNPSSSACATSSGNEGALDEMDEFDLFDSQNYGLSRTKSELDLYLEEPRLDQKQNAVLDILCYWKANSVRYPQLSSMARDILSIPITSVASESAFSIGGRIIGKYRSSIFPKNVEALLCTRDWIYDSVSKDSDEDEELEEDFEVIVARFGTNTSLQNY